MPTTLSQRREAPGPKPTLAQVRALARQLPPASRRKLLADLYAAEMTEEVREITAISRAVQTDVQAKGLPPITDADIARELKAARRQRAA